MQETQILSTPSPAATATPKRALVFDACHAGVVLRAVLFVEAVAGVGAMFATETPAQWLAVLALLTGGVLPATLAWLLVACSLKVWLQRLSIAQQYTAGVLLGTLAGLLACALLALVLADNPPWLACAAAGALALSSCCSKSSLSGSP
jgi:two-component system sensor histidine kinase AlgZ